MKVVCFPLSARQLKARVPSTFSLVNHRDLDLEESFVDIKVVDSDLQLYGTYNVSRKVSPSCQFQIQYQRITTRRMTRTSITPRSRRGEVEQNVLDELVFRLTQSSSSRLFVGISSICSPDSTTSSSSTTSLSSTPTGVKS